MESISSTHTADSSSSGNEIDSMSRPFDQSTNDCTSNAQLSDLVDNFHTDGFLTLSSLLTPQFTTGLYSECMDIFDGVLEWLLLKGDVEFSSSYRKQTSTTSVDKQTLTEDTSSTTSVYEYPLSVGLKNGYKELVMRSPGRYEMALLIDELPQHYQNRLFDQQDELVDRLVEPADYEGKWLMNTKLLDRVKADRCIYTSINNIEESPNMEHNCKEKEEEKSYLKQLLEWIQHPLHRSSSTNESNDGSVSSKEHEHQYPIDQANVARFMKLVSAIYPPSPSSKTSSNSIADNDVNNTTTTTTEETDNNTQQHQNDYYICNLSLLVATPGCPTQSWHADGGHTSLTNHEPCHVFNVFIPLVDVPLSMGPTELRPGTHYHTRNLASMMLVAKARKTLRSPVTPELKMGDALVFDYRILHRGRANMGDVVTQDLTTDDSVDGNDVKESTTALEEEERSADDGCGRHRPVLVITFARRWFVDVCNFPKRSIFNVEG